MGYTGKKEVGCNRTDHMEDIRVAKAFLARAAAYAEEHATVQPARSGDALQASSNSQDPSRAVQTVRLQVSDQRLRFPASLHLCAAAFVKNTLVFACY